MKTRDILITVTRILPGWHVYNDHQFGRITAFDPQAGYEVTVNLPDSDTISIVRTRYELVEDNTVLDTADMGEEQALDELARLLASPMPRTDRLMRLKDKFEKTAEWCRDTLGDEQEAKDVEDMAEHYMHVCEACNNKYSARHDPVSVFEGWLLGEELGTPYETRRQAASRMLSNVHRLDKEGTMLDIEKTLQSVRDLLDRLSKEGVEFTLVESEYSDYVADIRGPNKVYVFLECSIRPNGTFVWRDYDHHKGVCDFDEFRVRIITLTANKYLDKAKDKRKQWASLCEGTDTPMPESLAVTVSDMEDKANRLKALLEPDDPPLLDGRDIAILKELKPYGVVKPAEESQRLRELGVLERRYYIDQVFDAPTDKGEKALEFASHVERTKRRTS